MSVEYNTAFRYMTEENLTYVDDLMLDWDLEDCPEADLPDDFFNDMRNTQQQICKRDNITNRQLGVELRPLLRMRVGTDFESVEW